MNKSRTIPLIIAALALTFAAAPASAQDGYLFGMPHLSLSLRLGGAHPAASDDIFNFFTDELTLGRSDFAAIAYGAQLGVRVHRRVDVVLDVATSSSSSRSEFRDYVEDNDLPIEQTTELMRTPLTLGVKVHLLSRGRSLGRYAFVPARVTPYVGAGGGVMWYDLKQEGDFVDFETLDIFTDFFSAEGVTPTAYLVAGSDLWLHSRVGLNLEARYNWAKADLDGDFSDFDQVDLRGLQWTIGVTVR
jgi:hypothetical protein